MRKYTGIIAFTLFFFFCTSVNVWAEEVYFVKSGDNLWRIAQTHGTSVNKLMQINNLKNDSLQVGQKLILRPLTSTTPPPEQVNEETPETAADNPLATYIVQSGDNLWKIANSLHTTVDNLKELNNLSADNLYIGQELIVSNNGQGINRLEHSSRGGMPFNGDRIVQYASQYLGTPYRYGGQSPSGFDCSGFTSYIFNKFQIKLNRTAAAQYNQGVAVAKNELEIGDLIFFAGGRSIDHVGIYSGNGQIIHSSSPSSGGVIYSSINEGYYARTYVGAKRIR